MSVIDDLKKLSSRQRRIIQRAAGKLLRELPTVHTVVINRKPGIDTARMYTDFELTVFVNPECEVECEVECAVERKHTVSESVYNKGSGKVSESYRIYDPGYAYMESFREVLPNEAEALSFEYTEIYENTRQAYLELLKNHLKLYVKSDCMNVVTVNAAEMKRGNPLYYKLYIINLCARGYVVYNRDIQAIITIHKQL